MNISIDFPDFERLIASLGQTIADAVAEAGCDAEKTLSQIREASRFAHVQARLLDRVSEALAGEVLVNDDNVRIVQALGQPVGRDEEIRVCVTAFLRRFDVEGQILLRSGNMWAWSSGMR